MMTITFENALNIYAELVECYFGRNGYGGNTAEIYCYRLTTLHMSYKPPHLRSTTSAWSEDYLQNDIDAANNLKMILFKIKERYDLEFEDIIIDGEDMATWTDRINREKEGISHRVHVRIERKNGDGKL